MLKSSREVVSLNPAALPFTYAQHKERSASSSSSSASSSSGTSTATQTSQSTIHPTKFPPNKFKEFIPRNQSILNFNPTEISSITTKLDSSPSECIESKFSSGLASSIPSDTTFTTQDGTKPEDLLLSMKYLLLQAHI